MRSKLMLCVVLALASSAYAKDPKAYQAGKILHMDSVSCGKAGNEAPELLCQEYTLQADQVVYRIRPRDRKRPVLLPVSDRAQFRLQKNKMLLRVEDLDFKEREYEVVSMAPRTDSTAADATPVHLNHLQ
jgi:hypothetical protein